MKNSAFFPDALLACLQEWQEPFVLLGQEKDPCPCLRVHLPERNCTISLQRLPTQSLPASLSNFFQQNCMAAEKEGAQLVHIWEDQWYRNPALVKARLYSLLGKNQRLHGRSTQCQWISQEECANFLANNHLNVVTKSAKRVGLFYQGKLFALCSFAKSRKFVQAENYRSVELIRTCTAMGYTIVGGLDKMLRFYEAQVQVQDIMTYADRDWSVGKSYEAIGFEAIGEQAAQSFWVNPKTFERHYERELPKDLPTDWLRIFNAGSKKYRRRTAHGH